MKYKYLLIGKKIRLRDVEIEDAAYIHQLRTNPDKNRFLSASPALVSHQIAFIQAYKHDARDYYYIIENNAKQAVGTIRIYDIREQDFCWGSWIIDSNAPNTAAIESAVLIYEYAFYSLNFDKCHFDVRKSNERVSAFHLRMGARLIKSDELNHYFEFTRLEYELIRDKYSRFVR